MVRAAAGFADIARGSTLTLYLLVCGLCALATGIVSLDGAVVLMVPLVLALGRNHDVPVAPLFLGVVLVANTASIAVPQGNPTNLVVMNTAELTTNEYLEHMFVPSVVATIVCVAVLAVAQRRALAGGYQAAIRPTPPVTRDQMRAAIALACAAAAAWLSPLVGIAPWWPFCAVVGSALAVGGHRMRPRVPWRIVAQVAGLTVVIQVLGLRAPGLLTLSLPGLLAMTAAVGVAAALANNLPVSVSTASLFAAGQAPYAVSIGLALGALATPQGSVATQLAADFAGSDVPRLSSRLLAPFSAAALTVAAFALWLLL